MKKFLFIFLSVFCLEQLIIAGPEESICAKFQKCINYVCLVADIKLARLAMSEDDILLKSAEHKDSRAINYCLMHKIGDPFARNQEGQTVLSIARIHENKEVIEAIEEAIEKSPISVVRKKYD